MGFQLMHIAIGANRPPPPLKKKKIIIIKINKKINN